MLTDIKADNSVNILNERYRFHQRSQRSEELLHEYVQDIIKLAAVCNFQEFTDQLVRDRILFGICDETVKLQIISDGGSPNVGDIIRICDAAKCKYSSKYRKSMLHLFDIISK